MENTIPAGTYSVQQQAQLVQAFPVQKLDLVSVGSVLKPGRTSQSGKTATAHYVPTVLKASDGTQVMVDGTKLAAQAATDETLRKAVFAKWKGSIAGDQLIVEQCEFKATFSIGLANGKFSC